LNTWQSKGASALPEDALGLAEITVLVVDADEIEQVRAKLLAAGYPFTQDGETLLVRDPSGNPIRLAIQQSQY
jgi:catechol-2,3-dioxygenase